MVVRPWSRSRYGQHFAIITSTPDEPPNVQHGPRRRELGLVDDDGRERRHASTFTSRVSTVHWQSFDHRPIQGLLLWPHHLPEEQTPLSMIVLVHGGPTGLSGYGFSDTRSMGWAQSLAARLPLLFPELPGSMASGTEFAELNNRDLGGGDLEDVLTGIGLLYRAGLGGPRPTSARAELWRLPDALAPSPGRRASRRPHPAHR
ncbi:MAG: hypothetical protein R2849_19680 [Thermomicrobiales bacterium]